MVVGGCRWFLGGFGSFLVLVLTVYVDRLYDFSSMTLYK